MEVVVVIADCDYYNIKEKVRTERVRVVGKRV